MKQSKLIPLLGLGLTLFLSQPHLIYASSGYGGGSGTEGDPYLISTPEHLNQLQLDVNVNGVSTSGKYYQLANNIDLSGYDNDSDETNGNFTPIGNSSSISFKGTFDGNGYVISNLEIILSERDCVGLFGYTYKEVIRDLGVENVTIKGKDNVGGLVGYQDNGEIRKSYAAGKIDGNDDIGGLIGYQNFGDVYESYTTGSVSGSSNVGGLVGYQGNGEIYRSYATGSASGTAYVGGLVGYQYGTIIQSYAIGEVSGSSNVGGLVGYRLFSTTKDNYWNVETSGQGYSSTGVGLTTEQMTKRKAKENMVGFDFDVVWQESNGYPLLYWQTPNPIPEQDLIINGKIETMIVDVTIPSVSPDLVINPNLPEGSVSPEFNISNDSVSPIRLELKVFEQTTNTFNDVLPSKYDSWEGLNKRQSQDLALGLVAKEGDGWQSLTTPTSYVANHITHEIGIIKPTSTVDFSFDVKHGTSFSEAKTVQYKMIFVFDLIN